jgi:hypothetical protein
VETDYLASALHQFRYYKSLGEKAMAQLPEERLFWQPDPESNSIAIIVQHLGGNMRSRWTGFLTSDGEKAWRERDAEFEPGLQTREELLRTWEEGWGFVFRAVEPLQPADLLHTVNIRQEPHTVLDAINRQLTHYAYHVGQVVYLAKMQVGGDWETLSMPKKKR